MIKKDWIPAGVYPRENGDRNDRKNAEMIMKFKFYAK